MIRLLNHGILLLLFLVACNPPTELMPSASPFPHAPAPPSALKPSVAPRSSPAPNLLSSAKPSKKITSLLVPNKLQFQPGEAMSVRFQMAPQDKDDETAWVGLVPAEVPHGQASDNDVFDLAYVELGPHTQGTLDFIAPDFPGSYELRLHDSAQGREILAVGFQVEGEPPPLQGNALRLNKIRYLPGEPIEVAVSIAAENKRDETAWVGLLPAVIPHGDENTNDQYQLAYQYLGPFILGKMTFQAPQNPGLYDFRLHDSDDLGKELAFVTFLVARDTP